MKICIVSPFPVLPPLGGNRARTLAMMRALQDLGHELHFAYMPSRRVADADRDVHVETFGGDRVHWLRRGGWRSAFYYVRRAANKAIRALGRALGQRWGYYHRVDSLFYAPFQTQLAGLQDRLRFDAALVQYVSASKTLEAFGPAALKVLDTHDSFVDRHRADPGQDTYSLTEAEEAAGLRRADVVIAIQAAEAERFRLALGPDAAKVHTVSHLLDLSRRVQRLTPDAAFIGSIFNANLASLNYFIDQVLPLVAQARPDFCLWVAGTIASVIEDGPNLRTLGPVEHVSDAFARGSIALNPIVKGTGINIKILDAMAAGVPSVSTVYGARGLDGFCEGMIVVPDDSPHAFADAVVQLAADEGRRAALGARAYDDARIWNERQHAALNGIFADRSSRYGELRKAE